jgi:hypothetical protein
MNDKTFRRLLAFIGIVFLLLIGTPVGTKIAERHDSRQILHSEINRQCEYDIMSYKILSVSTEHGISSICVQRGDMRDCCENIHWTEEMRATVDVE